MQIFLSCDLALNQRNPEAVKNDTLVEIGADTTTSYRRE